MNKKTEWCNINPQVKQFYIIKEDTDMAYKINDGCVSCGACVDACPVGAISEGDGKYVINADACVDCGTCETT